jgi:stage II sporulation protein AA (anti-sigma F factor antagonist)
MYRSIAQPQSKGRVSMKIMSTYRNGRLTLRLSGELDHHGARERMEEIQELLDRYLPRDTVLELSGLTFMDSSGIAIIIRVHKRMQELNGRTWIENPQPQPLRVIDTSGIDRLIRISTTVREGKG